MGTAIVYALIALGIAGKVLFGRRNGRIQNELRRRSIDRLKNQKALYRLRVSNYSYLKKLEPRTLSPCIINILIEKIRGKTGCNMQFVVEQDDKARTFAWSIEAASTESGVFVRDLPNKMLPGEKLSCAVVLYCPNGSMSDDDLLYEALNLAKIHVGRIFLTTLSLETTRPTLLDIGKTFSYQPTGSSLPNDEYIIWVSEQTIYDDQFEFNRRLEEMFDDIRKINSTSH